MNGVKLVRGLPIYPAGSLYCFDPLNKSAARSALAPVFKRYLIPPEKRELHWCHKFLFPPARNAELSDAYIAEYFWNNTPVPATEPFRPPVLNKPPAEWAPAGVKPGDYVLVNATSGWKKKMWSVDGWASLIFSFRKRHRFILTSGDAFWQRDHCGLIANATGSELVRTSMREFLWLCANAHAVLTVDGAASHLAAAFSIPCLTLFGPTSMAQWHRSGPNRIAFQAAMDDNGVRNLRNAAAGPVIEAARDLGL